MSFLKLNTIPYYPELGKKLGGITPAILMRQLEYWFDKNKYKNFYKFLEPCDNGSYKEGDSWIEEIGISKAEFRNAFSKIGVVYKSKKEFKEAEDKFQGKPYCSYIDRMERRTYYVRNHEKVKEILNAVTNEDAEFPRNQESEFLEIKKVDFGKSRNLTSRNQESEFPITVDYTVDYQKNTTVEKDDDTKLDKLNKIEDEKKLDEPKEEKEVRPMVSSSIEFKNDLKELKDIAVKSTGINKMLIDNIMLPSKYRDINIRELINKIKESKFLLGELDTKPNINHFSVRSMIDRIMADGYMSNDSKNIKKNNVEEGWW
jgi:hypothetical protein